MVIKWIVVILAFISMAVEMMLIARILEEYKFSKYPPSTPVKLIGIFSTIFLICFTIYRIGVDAQSILTICVILGGFIYSVAMNQIITYKTK